jgi:sulfate transport system ATP-binding protein
MSIEIVKVNKEFGTFAALKDISLTVPSGELVALLGPSGCGKTTLLRIIAGLETAETGRILLDGVETTERSVRERQVGFVFQHYALFRHMTVFDNVAFGLTVKPRRERPDKATIRAKVSELLRLIQLEHLADRYPSQLSGGQRQRVALARALAVEPKVLLLDEPFGALDAQVRVELRRWLRKLHDEIHITSVFVTHDQEEALEVADRIVVMNQGKIEQEGTPAEVYDNPATPFVFSFLGNVNMFHGRGLPGSGGAPAGGSPASSTSVGYVRSHDIEVERQVTDSSAEAAIVCLTQTVGPVVRVELKLVDNDTMLEAELSRDVADRLSLKKGETVFVRPRKVKVFAVDFQI